MRSEEVVNTWRVVAEQQRQPDDGGEGEREKENLMFCCSPQPTEDDRMIPVFHKALEAFSDSLFARRFLSRRLLKYLLSPSDSAESTGTNTRHNDFWNFVL